MLLVFLHQEPSEGKITLSCSASPSPLTPPAHFCLFWPQILALFLEGVCTSHSWLEDNSRRSGALEPAPVTSASKLMGVCPTDGLNGGLNPKAKCLTKDSFLQTGSFDTFTESADLLMCSRGYISPTPHYRSVLKLLYISFLFCTLGVRVLKSYRYVSHRGRSLSTPAASHRPFQIPPA